MKFKTSKLDQAFCFKHVFSTEKVRFSTLADNQSESPKVNKPMPNFVY